MPGTHFLQIARLTVALRCDDPSIVWHWDPAVRRFLTSPATTDVDLTVRAVERIPRAEGEVVFDSGSVWRLLRVGGRTSRPPGGGRDVRPPDGDAWLIECSSELIDAEPYKAARFNEDFTRGEILLAPAALPLHVSPLDYPLDELLIANLLGHGRGVELHACGVIDRDGRGHVFAGVSGAGKTTNARFWESTASAVVSDDRVIVRELDGELWMFGTPWHGEADLASPEGARIAGVYLIVQAEANSIHELEHATAVARLLSCSFPPFYDADAMDYTVGLLDRLAQRVPVRELRFTPDASVVELVRAEA